MRPEDIAQKYLDFTINTPPYVLKKHNVSFDGEPLYHFNFMYPFLTMQEVVSMLNAAYFEGYSQRIRDEQYERLENEIERENLDNEIHGDS